MQDAALDHPAERLQADVRMRADVEPLARGVIRRPGVIQETPGADHAPMPVRQRAADLEAFADDGAMGFEALLAHG